MRHIPHLFVPEAWDAEELVVPDAAHQHLTRVLRYGAGELVTYTDGVGTFGEGTWMGGTVRRGPEHRVAPPGPHLTIAVAPPKARERQRFIVEKLQEVEVDALVWLTTRHTEGRPPSAERSGAWAIGALEQSRGTRLMQCTSGSLSDLEEPIVARLDGGAVSDLTAVEGRITIAIGPEGGFTESEVGPSTPSLALGRTVLRTETAAVAAGILVRAHDSR
jgi:16S rRNA U1498 N3-methylase RsmE